MVNQEIADELIQQVTRLPFNLQEKVLEYAKSLSKRKPRVADLNKGAIQTRDDFDAPLPDDFWSPK